MTEKMHILVGTGSLFQNASGPFLSVRSTATALAKRGLKVTILGSKDENQQVMRPPSYAEHANLQPVALNKFGPYSLHLTPGVTTFLQEKGPFDVASFQNVWLWNCAKAARYCVAHGIPYIISPRGVFNSTALNISKFKKRIARHWFVNRFLKEATCFQALSEQEYTAIRRAGIRQPVALIPNGVFIPEKATTQASPNLPEAFEGQKILLFLGRLHPIKNIEALLDAWGEIEHNYRHQWRLVIAGNGTSDYEHKLQEKLNKLGLQEQVYFPGFIGEKEKPSWFGRADAFILPSLSEGMPMAALEAMSYGLPSVLSEACNLPEAYAYNAAIRCDTSIEGIKKGILQLIEKPDVSVTENALRLVREKFSWNIVSDKLLEVYHWMINPETSPPDCIILD